MKILLSFLLIIILSNYSFSQSNVNPNISAIGTFNTYTNFIKGTPEYGKINFENPSLELFIDGYLNPYARATADVAYEDGEFGLEELYANIVRGLPLDVQIKAGKYLVGFGKLNTVHTHAMPFLARPLFHQIYFGEEGFNDIGVNLSFILPTETFYSNIDLGIFRGDAIAKSDAGEIENINELRGTSPIFVGRLGTFFSLSDFNNLEVGLSASYGTHAKTSYYFQLNGLPDPIQKSLKYLYTGLDFKYKYRPDSYTSLTIQGEALLNNREVLKSEYQNPIFFSEEKISTFGAFIFIDYAFEKKYSIGLKYDYTYGIIGDEPGINSLSNDDQNKTTGISGWFGYYPIEETIALKLGVQHLMFDYANGINRDGETTIKLQMIFSLGPHKAHPF